MYDACVLASEPVCFFEKASYELSTVLRASREIKKDCTLPHSYTRSPDYLGVAPLFETQNNLKNNCF